MAAGSNQGLKVLHLVSEKPWRGGENQVRLLIEHSVNEGVAYYLGAPEDSKIYERLQPVVKDRIACRFSGLGLIGSAYRLARFCRSKQIHIIDCHSSKAHLLGLFTKFFYRKLGLVIHRRVDFVPGNSYLHRRKYQSSKVNRYVPISQSIARVLKTHCAIPSDKISVVYSAVDGKAQQAIDTKISRSKICEELKLDPAKKIIINVAYHTSEKGLFTLVEALGKLKQHCDSEFYCLFAGEGPETPALEERVRQLNLGQDVRFLGVRSDVPQLLAAADIFAFPSRCEGLGTSILDAIHAGCVVAATNVGGIPEIVRHEQTGLLSPVDDAEGLAENLKALLTQDSLVKALSTEARRHVEETFSVQKMAEGNMKIYRELLSEIN